MHDLVVGHANMDLAQADLAKADLAKVDLAEEDLAHTGEPARVEEFGTSCGLATEIAEKPGYILDLIHPVSTPMERWDAAIAVDHCSRELKVVFVELAWAPERLAGESGGRSALFGHLLPGYLQDVSCIPSLRTLRESWKRNP